MGTAPSIRSLGTVVSGPTGTPSFAEPAGAVADDVIACIWFQDDARTSAANPTPPAGFVTATDAPQLNDPLSGSPGHALQVWLGRRSAVGVGPYTFTINPGTGSATPFCEGRAVAIQDVPASFLAMIEAADGATTGNTNASTAPAVSATSAGPDRLALYAATNWSGGAWTEPGGYTELWDANNRIASFDSLTLTAPGTTTPQAVNASTNRMNAWVGIFPSADTDSGYIPRIPLPLLRLLLTRRQALVDAAQAATPITLADSGAETEAVTITAAATLADTSAASDALTVAVSATLTDTAAAANSITITATITLADTAAAADTITSGVPTAIADTASASQAFTTAAAVPLADTGTAADTLAVIVQVALTDAGAALEVLQTNASVPLTDTATAADSVTNQAPTPPPSYGLDTSTTSRGDLAGTTTAAGLAGGTTTSGLLE